MLFIFIIMKDVQSVKLHVLSLYFLNNSHASLKILLSTFIIFVIFDESMAFPTFMARSFRPVKAIIVVSTSSKM